MLPTCAASWCSSAHGDGQTRRASSSQRSGARIKRHSREGRCAQEQHWDILDRLLARNAERDQFLVLQSSDNMWNYRPELDGLRAVAVVSVILFHAQGLAPGGYVGVDVFFTLSGYLVTCVIASQLDVSRFSLRDFWMRRIRRLMPAALVVSATCLAWGYFFMAPNDLRSVGKSNLAQLALLANVHFWRESGYFAEVAHTKPLLHYWSLAVEEQYYIVFPPVLVVLWRISSARRLLVTGGVGVASLLACVYASRVWPEGNFYLLPTRAWELLVGSSLALWTKSWSRPFVGRRRQWIGWLGLAGVVAPVITFDDTTPFPGLAALLPVLGTAMIIWSTEVCAGGALSRFLAVRPVVALGRLSYSLYLWHWPFFVGLEYSQSHFEASQVACALLATVVAALLSFYLVESPIRKGRWFRSNRALILALSLLVAAQAAVSAWFVATEGVSARLDSSRLQRMHRDMLWHPPQAKIERGIVSGVRLGRRAGADVDFVVWGDSHGGLVAAVMDRIADRAGRSGVDLSRNMRLPGLGFWRPSKESRDVGLSERQAAVDWIEEIAPAALILAGRWQLAVNEENFQGVVGLLTDDYSDPHQSSVKQSRIALGRGLKLLVERMRAKGVKVVIIRQVPELSILAPARDVFMAEFHSRKSLPRLPAQGLLNHVGRREFLDQMFAEFESADCVVMDPSWFFIDDQRLLYVSPAGLSLYVDSHHLSLSGVEFLADRIEGDIKSALQWR